MRSDAHISTFSNTLHNSFQPILKERLAAGAQPCPFVPLPAMGQGLELAPGLALSQELLLLFSRSQHQHESNQDLSFPRRTGSPHSIKQQFSSGRGQGRCPAQRCFSDRQAASREVHVKMGDSTAGL